MKVQIKASGKEGVNVDSINANNCNTLLLVVDNRVSKEEVAACIEISDNQDGLVCCEFKIIQRDFCIRWVLSVERNLENICSMKLAIFSQSPAYQSPSKKRASLLATR